LKQGLSVTASVVVGESNSAGVQLTSRSMRLLQTESSEDGQLCRQQIWSGRPRKTGEFQTIELKVDQCQTRNVVRVIAAERSPVLVP